MSDDLVMTRKDRPNKCYLKSLLTVELSYKWYCLYLVDPLGVVSEVTFDALEETEHEVAFVDHVPYPGAVQRLAEKNGWHVDEVAYELMVGRWEIEVQGTYMERY